MTVNNIWLAVLLMAGVTYLIRVLPLLLIRREIRNKTVRSFLYYVPYVTLSVMTFPAILSATATVWSALGGTGGGGGALLAWVQAPRCGGCGLPQCFRDRACFLNKRCRMANAILHLF